MASFLYEMVPFPIADQLLKNKRPTARRYHKAGLLFVKVSDFSDWVKSIPMSEIVPVLNTTFSCFDKLVTDFSNDCSKLENICELYIVSTGIVTLPDNQTSLASLALKMRDAVPKLQKKTKTNIQLRFGMHTGPVVAGIMGEVVPKFTIIGETMNLASRMESSGEPMRIQITDQLRHRLQHSPRFRITPRGPVMIKGVGTIHTYWLDRYNDDVKETPMLSSSENKDKDIEPMLYSSENKDVEPERFFNRWQKKNTGKSKDLGRNRSKLQILTENQKTRFGRVVFKRDLGEDENRNQVMNNTQPDVDSGDSDPEDEAGAASPRRGVLPKNHGRRKLNLQAQFPQLAGNCYKMD